MSQLLVLSSSSLHTFQECRKSYDLTYFRGLEPLHDNAAIERGTSFHEHAATFADYYHSGDTPAWNVYAAAQREAKDEMFPVFQAYRKNRWDIKPEQIILASAGGTRREHPIFVPLVKTGGYDVWIRFTLDLAYRRETGWLVSRDYKTFSAFPSTANSDLDYQGRGSIAAMQRYFKEDRVEFEWDYARIVVPGSPRGTGPWTPDTLDGELKYFKIDSKGKRTYADQWTIDECYTRESLTVPRSESDEMWREMQDTAKDLVRCMREGRWYRAPRRGTMPYTCHTCLAKHLCRAEIGTGTLDEDTIAGLASPRSPLVIPDADWLRFRKRLPVKVVEAA